MFKVTGGMGQAVKAWSKLTPDKIEDAALDAGEAVAEHLLGIVADRATTPRWEHVASYFKVVRAGGNVGVWIPPDYPESREAFLLEYGDGDSSPKPILRNAIAYSYREHSKMFGAELNKRLFSGVR